MNTFKIDKIKSETLPETIYLDLFNLSTFKNSEFGFSFMVKKTYIETYLNDLKNDGSGNPMYPNIYFYEKLLSEMETDYLFIEN